MSKHIEHKHTEYEAGCLPLPRFERVKYFYGQLLGVREFQAEQSYFLEKHRLHNRYLHGYGVVCGLAVDVCRAPHDPCDPPEKPRDPTTQQIEHASQQALVHTHEPGSRPELPARPCIEVDCGIAIDCQGNEIVVPWPTQVDLLAALGCDARERLLKREAVYVSICFKERPLEPVRPLTADSCGGLLPDCVPSRLRDDFCIRVSWTPPEHDRACSACERPCTEPCLVLAKVAWTPDYGLAIYNGVRRPLAQYVTTKVEGVSWVQGATYRPGDVDKMLLRGIRIWFTDEVRTDTLVPGVLDVWIVQGGENRSSDIYNVDIDLEPSHPNGPYSKYVTAVLRGPDRKRHDRLDPGDRVLIQLRSAFILDRCCRALDGEHIGGRVPYVQGYTDFRPTSVPVHAACRPPEPRTYLPWTSGNGTPGGTFESWFYVGDDEKVK